MCRRLVWLLWLGVVGPPGLAAMEFPGPYPGVARGEAAGAVFTLENDVLALRWTAEGGSWRPYWHWITNKLEPRGWGLGGAEVFRLTTDDGDEVPASAFAIVRSPELRAVAASNEGSRAGDRFPGLEVSVGLRHEASGLEVDWRAVLREGANYVRQFIAVRAVRTNVTLTHVAPMELVAPSRPEPAGTALGSPGVIGQTFFAAESPFANGAYWAYGAQFGFPCSIPLDATAQEFSGVVGVVPAGQLRRGFLYYLERERARPYRQMLNWNTWLDVLWCVEEAGVSTAMADIDRELRQRRGVAVESYAIDDAWDDPRQGFWAIDTNRFPNGFSALRDQAQAIGTHLGVWISPLGGYENTNVCGTDFVQSLARARAAVEAGLVTGALDLSSPPYYDWWVNQCRSYIEDYGVNYLKWDRAGEWISPHFMALLRAAVELRRVSTNLVINTTVGTWPSPFWLHWVDTIWRGGYDVYYDGQGDLREQWLTYRDAQTYVGPVVNAPLFPLNSLMLHGLLCARHDFGTAIAGPDLLHEARSYFGSGTQLQELYLTPGMMSSNGWDQIAEAVRWARANEDVLVDTHWVGGNPRELQVYGWASWTRRKATLVLRNPSAQSNAITLDIGAAFELPAGAPVLYDFCPAYTNQRTPFMLMEAGRPARVTLAPFEVLVLEAFPRTNHASRLLSLGPLAYWRLGDPVGPKARDSAHGHHGTYFHAVQQVLPGAVMEGDDGAVGLLGSGSHVTVADGAPFAFSGTNDFTLTAWGWLDGFVGVRRLISNRRGDTGFGFGVAGNVALNFTAYGVAQCEVPVPPLAPDRWYHFSLVRRGSRVEFYLDGEWVGTRTATNLLASSGSLRLGGSPDGPEEPLVGLLDDVAVFGKALTSAEIGALHRARDEAPPEIVQQPSPAQGYQGSIATFTVVAVSGLPMTHQWLADGLPIPGATNAVLTLTNLSQASAQMAYGARISNAVGVTASASATLTVIVPPPHVAAMLEDQPLAYWWLGETNGPAIRDSIGHHDGWASGQIIFGQPGHVSGDADTALRFSAGPGGKVDVPFAEPLNPAVFSVELWARVTGGAGWFRSPLTSRDVEPLAGYLFYAGADDHWQFWTAEEGTGAWHVAGGPAVAPGAWTHLVGTYDGTNKSFYVNAQLAHRAATSFVRNTRRPLRIGAGATEGPGVYFFDGEVDEVAIYSSALSPEQVENHYRASRPTDRLLIEREETDLLLFWPVGTLETAEQIDGEWFSVPNAISPWRADLNSPRRFFRVRLR